MSIQNYFADFLEESPVDVAQLTTFSEHIPDEIGLSIEEPAFNRTIR
ncbi:hypothetical protein [Vibrio vulnificus]